MEDINNCEIVHSLIYDSLRVVFVLSLISILISIFSIMTLYQLYIHERQKIFLNQNTGNHILRDQILNQNGAGISNTNQNNSGSFFGHFNHLYPAVGAGGSGSGGAQTESKATTSLTQVRCLSAEFSSQDLLIDQSSTNFGVSIPEQQQQHLSSRDRIWSSQSSSNCPNPVNYSKADFSGISGHQSAKMRRYFDVIVRKSSNVQEFVSEKFRSLKKSMSTDSDVQIADRFNRNRNKSKLLPPHVISRYSRKQYSIDSTNLSNYPQSESKRPSTSHRDSIQFIDKRSNSTYSSTSSSHRSTSVSTSSVGSKNPHYSSHHTTQCDQSYHSHNHTQNDQQQSMKQQSTQSSQSTPLNDDNSGSNFYLKDEDNLVKTSFNGELTPDDNHNHQLRQLITNDVDSDNSPAFDCPDLLYMSNVYMNHHEPGLFANLNHFTENELESMPYSVNHQQPDNQQDHWSNSKILNTFQCIDEDDYSEQFKTTESQFSKLLRNNDDNQVEFYEKPIADQTATATITPVAIPDHHQCQIVDIETEPNNLSPDEKLSEDTKFTFGSELNNNIHYVTTFEEAFKNYYDSQNRISHQQQQQQNHYNTMPVKLSKERSKRTKSLNHHSNFRLEQRHQFRRTFESSAKQSMFVASSQATQQNSNLVEQPPISSVMDNNNLMLLSDDEVPFPAIEPPADYKNVCIAMDTNDNLNQISSAVPDNQILQQQSPNPASNSNLQPFQFWVQQFIDQINRTQLIDTAKIYNPNLINEYDDSAVNGFVVDDEEDGDENVEEDEDDDEEDDEEDDDGAGDTSTSQDIADFEFELDEEPIKFIGDEEYHQKEVTKLNDQSRPEPLAKKPGTIIRTQQQQPPQAAQPKAAQVTLIPNLVNANPRLMAHHHQNHLDSPEPIKPLPPPTLPSPQPDDNNNLLKNNTNLIKRTVQLNNLTADYGFDGFRKGCFDDGDDSSSTSSSSDASSSSTNSSSFPGNAKHHHHNHHQHQNHHGHHGHHHNHHNHRNSNSFTAEYIKPPTPFTNYYNNPNASANPNPNVNQNSNLNDHPN